jgi:hypothetical protein
LIAEGLLSMVAERLAVLGQVVGWRSVSRGRRFGVPARREKGHWAGRLDDVSVFELVERTGRQVVERL